MKCLSNPSDFICMHLSYKYIKFKVTEKLNSLNYEHAKRKDTEF